MSIQQQITVPQWLSLRADVREEMKKLFNIPKSSGARVTIGVRPIVESDGHTHADLATITVEKLAAFLDVPVTKESNIFSLFDAAVTQVESYLNAKAEEAVRKLEEEQEELEKEEKVQALKTVQKVAALAGDVLDEDVPQETKKKNGRPKGSKNKPKKSGISLQVVEAERPD